MNDAWAETKIKTEQSRKKSAENIKCKAYHHHHHSITERGKERKSGRERFPDFGPPFFPLRGTGATAIFPGIIISFLLRSRRINLDPHISAFDLLRAIFFSPSVVSLLFRPLPPQIADASINEQSAGTKDAFRKIVCVRFPGLLLAFFPQPIF